jgi:HEPN domain-containing protein
MLSLAVVSYVKAMLAEMGGEVQSKEYYMREFFKKVSDNESNKRMQSITYPVSPFAVR